MVKEIRKIGNSHGIILDAATMSAANLKEGDQISVTLHGSGSLTLTPLNPRIEAEEASETARQIIAKNDELFRRLSK